MNGRPPSTAEMMEAVAEWLTIGDKAIGALAMMRGIPDPAEGKSVQGDLMLLAEWLRQHPDVDRQMLDCLSAVDVP